MEYVIYGLFPEDEDVTSIRYVGMTSNAPVRLLSHRRGNEGTQKDQWVTEVKSRGGNVGMVMLDTAATRYEALKKEGDWINFGINIGWQLVNTSIPVKIDQDIQDQMSYVGMVVRELVALRSDLDSLTENVGSQSLTITEQSAKIESYKAQIVSEKEQAEKEVRKAEEEASFADIRSTLAFYMCHLCLSLCALTTEFSVHSEAPDRVLFVIAALTIAFGAPFFHYAISGISKKGDTGPAWIKWGWMGGTVILWTVFSAIELIRLLL